MATHRIHKLAAGAGILLCSALSHAQTGIQIYGVIDQFFGRVEARTAAESTHTLALNNGGLTTSFIGFRGTEDLGGGLQAVFALESFIRADTGAIGRNDADPFWGRLAIVGFESAQWGRLSFGRHVTPYSLATTLHTPFVGSTTLSPVFSHVYNQNVQGGTRFDNAVQYSSPRRNAFYGDLLYSLGRENPSGHADRGRDRAFEAVGNYVNGPLKLVAGYHQIDLNNRGDGRKQRAWMGAGVYDFGALKLNAQHHRVRDTSSLVAGQGRRHTTELGVTIPAGNGNVLATMVSSRMDDLVPATPEARRGYALAYDYNLSRRTDVYTAYFRDRQLRPLNQSTIVAVGVRHRF